MTPEQFFGLYIFILAAFVGYQVITGVPKLLHTPLMSATNAISGISLVGAIVAAGGQDGRPAPLLGLLAGVWAGPEGGGRDAEAGARNAGAGGPQVTPPAFPALLLAAADAGSEGTRELFIQGTYLI